jgi:uncharacterized membrane protein YkgB
MLGVREFTVTLSLSSTSPETWADFGFLGLGGLSRLVLKRSFFHLALLAHLFV